MEAKDQVLDVWGNLACFSQPVFKVERFSYPDHHSISGTGNLRCNLL